MVHKLLAAESSDLNKGAASGAQGPFLGPLPVLHPPGSPKLSGTTSLFLLKGTSKPLSWRESDTGLLDRMMHDLDTRPHLLDAWEALWEV